MAEIKLTTSQQAVVDNRGGALLVSAAAGSGKTKVLVDRLLSRICDPDTPCDLDQFLVITYTKAAAAELRIKIAQAISMRLSADPGNQHLQRQMSRIYLASISTVHAFCSGLIKTYAHVLDIPADFRVAEEAECRVLQDKVLSDLLEQGYEHMDDTFRSMVDTFGYGRDDRRLPEAIKMAHRELRCRADMDGWLSNMLGALDLSDCTDAAQTIWGSYLMDHFRQFLTQQITNMTAALREMENYPNIQKALGTCFAENIRQLTALRDYQTWDEIVCNQVTEFGRAGVVRNPEDPAVKERLRNVRSLCWSNLKKWQENFFAPSCLVLEDLRQMAPGAAALLRFAKKFDKAYAAEKIKRKLLDFSDLEHLAIRLLTDRYTGKPTAVAKEVAKAYVEIMVDEYQDSNEVQDTIFEAISQSGKNRFMVGDVKQSIYRFRLADPSLFLRKYHAYTAWKDAAPGEPRKILLSENFRSRDEILSACNHVFRSVMRQSVGDLDYTKEEELKAGRNDEKLLEPAVELHCLTHSDPMEDKTVLEAEFTAARIREMLDRGTLITGENGLRPVQPGDFAILMRSLSSTAQDYLDALGRQGIPAVCDRGGNLLDTSEVQIMVSLLHVLDNPHQDIPLLTVLGSPVFGYSPEQLASPRTKNRKCDYYDAIADEETFAETISLLNELREDSKWMNLHELVDNILRKTNMLSVFCAMEDGLRRERNLMAFRSFTVSFEAAGSKTLTQLLWYLEDLRESGGQIPIPRTTAENAVTIMTIHSSKGLEFPVVFLCDLSRKFNQSDMQDAILVDNDLAVGCNRVDHERHVRYATIAKKAIIHKKTAESVSEELRILYVAMTRARERLVMTYYSRYLVTELKNINSQIGETLSDELCASVRNPGQWILMSALLRTEAGELFAVAGENDFSVVSDTPWKITFTDLAESEIVEEGVAEEKRDNSLQLKDSDIDVLKFIYPYAAVCDIPAKVTATQLKGRLQDQEVLEQADILSRPSAYHFGRPKFAKGEMSASDRGTATHLFLQFADYSACCTAEGIEMELDRLVRDVFLTEEQAAAVEKGQILKFFSCELGQWLLKQTVHREFKFSILLDAGKIFAAGIGEQVMLQGVVDCFVLSDDGLRILDFKTDKIPRPESYRSQLEAYGTALERIYGVPVKQKILYFFATGEAVYL